MGNLFSRSQQRCGSVSRNDSDTVNEKVPQHDEDRGGTSGDGSGDHVKEHVSEEREENEQQIKPEINDTLESSPITRHAVTELSSKIPPISEEEPECLVVEEENPLRSSPPPSFVPDVTGVEQNPITGSFDLPDEEFLADSVLDNTTAISETESKWSVVDSEVTNQVNQQVHATPYDVAKDEEPLPNTPELLCKHEELKEGDSLPVSGIIDTHDSASFAAAAAAASWASMAEENQSKLKTDSSVIKDRIHHGLESGQFENNAEDVNLLSQDTKTLEEICTSLSSHYDLDSQVQLSPLTEVTDTLISSKPDNKEGDHVCESVPSDHDNLRSETHATEDDSANGKRGDGNDHSFVSTIQPEAVKVESVPLDTLELSDVYAEKCSPFAVDNLHDSAGNDFPSIPDADTQLTCEVRESNKVDHMAGEIPLENIETTEEPVFPLTPSPDEGKTEHLPTSEAQQIDANQTVDHKKDSIETEFPGTSEKKPEEVYESSPNDGDQLLTDDLVKTIEKLSVEETSKAAKEDVLEQPTDFTTFSHLEYESKSSCSMEQPVEESQLLEITNPLDVLTKSEPCDNSDGDPEQAENLNSSLNEQDHLESLGDVMNRESNLFDQADVNITEEQEADKPGNENTVVSDESIDPIDLINTDEQLDGVHFPSPSPVAPVDVDEDAVHNKRDIPEESAFKTEHFVEEDQEGLQKDENLEVEVDNNEENQSSNITDGTSNLSPSNSPVINSSDHMPAEDAHLDYSNISVESQGNLNLSLNNLENLTPIQKALEVMETSHTTHEESDPHTSPSEMSTVHGEIPHAPAEQ